MKRPAQPVSAASDPLRTRFGSHQDHFHSFHFDKIAGIEPGAAQFLDVGLPGQPS
jgi:hypothetical protein